ncbi:MAG: RNA polymerase sigma factor [Anaerolinea sp.]|nr:RNA polymerase sigma factor [Anaerolinea sp.]
MRTDEELARGIQQGRRHDLSVLVERHHYALIGFLYRMTGGDRRLAEDLAQEALIRVMRAISTYEYPRPFKVWLYAIAANLARDHFKSADTRRTSAIIDDIPTLDCPEDAALDAEEARRVALALLKLPEPQRETVILRYYGDLSLAEIAEALDIPLGTVKSRISIGLSRLKSLLED